MNGEIRFEADGVCCNFVDSHDGTARIQLLLRQKKRTGKNQYYRIEVKLARSSIGCVRVALCRFIQKEIAAIEQIKGYL